MYYDFNGTVSFQSISNEYAGKYFWKCDAGYTSLPDDENVLPYVYDVFIYNNEADCNSDEDGRHALARFKVRSDNYSSHFERNKSGIIV